MLIGKGLFNPEHIEARELVAFAGMTKERTVSVTLD